MESPAEGVPFEQYEERAPFIPSLSVCNCNRFPERPSIILQNRVLGMSIRKLKGLLEPERYDSRLWYPQQRPKEQELSDSWYEVNMTGGRTQFQWCCIATQEMHPAPHQSNIYSTTLQYLLMTLNGESRLQRLGLRRPLPCIWDLGIIIGIILIVYMDDPSVAYKLQYLTAMGITWCASLQMWCGL